MPDINKNWQCPSCGFVNADSQTCKNCGFENTNDKNTLDYTHEDSPAQVRPSLVKPTTKRPFEPKTPLPQTENPVRPESNLNEASEHINKIMDQTASSQPRKANPNLNNNNMDPVSIPKKIKPQDEVDINNQVIQAEPQVNFKSKLNQGNMTDLGVIENKEALNHNPNFNENPQNINLKNLSNQANAGGFNNQPPLNPPPDPASPQQNQNAPLPPKKKGRGLLILLFILIFLTLTTGGALAYYFYKMKPNKETGRHLILRAQHYKKAIDAINDLSNQASTKQYDSILNENDPQIMLERGEEFQENLEKEIAKTEAVLGTIQEAQKNLSGSDEELKQLDNDLKDFYARTNTTLQEYNKILKFDLGYKKASFEFLNERIDLMQTFQTSFLAEKEDIIALIDSTSTLYTDYNEAIKSLEAPNEKIKTAQEELNQYFEKILGSFDKIKQMVGDYDTENQNTENLSLEIQIELEDMDFSWTAQEMVQEILQAIDKSYQEMVQEILQAIDKSYKSTYNELDDLNATAENIKSQMVSARTKYKVHFEEIVVESWKKDVNKVESFMQ
ncbi:MAG: hypothetical protein GF347_01115 [Candidatus Moranbacteria bacterium]|nr:hypothetical protein [Candidatus Moranbacteria bacterium]